MPGGPDDDARPGPVPRAPRPLSHWLLGLVALVIVVGPTLLLLGSGADARVTSLVTSGASTGVHHETLSPEAAAAAANELTPTKAVILGVVEGITEFLPVSSTGHLTVVQRWLGIGTTDATKEAADAYAVVIQAGAILAVVVLYWRRLISVANGVIGRDEDGRRVFIALVIAFLPSALIGVVFESKIKEHLFGVRPVIGAWIVGGVVLIAISTGGWLQRERKGRALELMTPTNALVIGVAQCLALWPGTSRSLVTIVAAVLIGMSLSAAVEFSFLLGLVTLSAATVLDGYKYGGEIVDAFGVASPLLGFVVAFVAAVIAVRWMVTYLQNHSLAIFGWYRIGVAVLAIVLVSTGVISAN